MIADTDVVKLHVKSSCHYSEGTCYLIRYFLIYLSLTIEIWYVIDYFASSAANAAENEIINTKPKCYKNRRNKGNYFLILLH